MKAIWSVLMDVYTRWRFVEETESDETASARPKAAETREEEILRLRGAIARERRNVESFLRFDCRALAAPCESSIRAMESRIRALDFRKAV